MTPLAPASGFLPAALPPGLAPVPGRTPAYPVTAAAAAKPCPAHAVRTPPVCDSAIQAPCLAVSAGSPAERPVR